MNTFIKQLLIFSFIISCFTGIYGQAGSVNTYKFLRLSPSARVSGLGSINVSTYDSDISLANMNPALLNAEATNNLSISHKFIFGGISSENLDYGFRIGKVKLPFHVGIQYLNYGEVDLADVYGDISGKVSGSDFAFLLGTSYSLYENLHIGLSTRIIYSNLGGYNSIGLTTDLGALYHLKSKNLDVGFVLRNIGGTLASYSDTKEFAPFNVMLGISKKLEHLPFRFSVTATDLNRWNLLYDNPNGENNILFGEETQKKSKISIFSDNLFRHFIFSGEFLLGKNGGPLRLRMAYNHRKSREMSIEPFRSFAGFSFGFGLKMRRFTIDYAYGIERLAGGKAHLTLSANLNEFRKKI
jgi:hypothetical protein